MFHSLVIAFSTYSRLPMPQVEWSEKNMKYAICFFPLIGAVIGALFLLWVWLCARLGLNLFLRAAGCVVLPLLVSGGIHMDGFCDTVDKDSHTGAFAVIFCGVWLVLDLGALTQPEALRSFGVLALGFVLSRAMSGLALANLKGARPSGMLQAFADASHKSAVTAVMLVFLVLSVAGMVWLSPVSGGAAALAAALCLLHYRRMSYRQFGGITGDLAGYFVQLAELSMALAAALTWRFV